MSSMKLLLFLPLVQGIPFDAMTRLNRHCHTSRLHPVVLTSTESALTLIFIFISGLLFLLIFLGIIKGLIGLLCWPKLGMYGLNLLIDLPRPLDRYQEKSLRYRPVIYDIGGWPIHPDTLEKTVRPIPKRTEFCLNLVFFLAYPLAACVYICALCCCIRNYQQSDENVCYKHVNVVRLTNPPKNDEVKNNRKESPSNVYKQDDKEAMDTQYVLDALRKCKDSINHIHIKTCSCDSDVNH